MTELSVFLLLFAFLVIICFFNYLLRGIWVEAWVEEDLTRLRETVAENFSFWLFKTYNITLNECCLHAFEEYREV